jgi:hypothetical protein
MDVMFQALTVTRLTQLLMGERIIELEEELKVAMHSTQLMQRALAQSISQSLGHPNVTVSLHNDPSFPWVVDFFETPRGRDQITFFLKVRNA